MNLEVIKIRISKLLEMYPYMYSRALTFSDFDALNTVIDLNIAVSRANLTDREKQILYKTYALGLTQNEIAEETGLTRNQVRYGVDKILIAVGRAYYYPERHTSRKGDKNE